MKLYNTLVGHKSRPSYWSHSRIAVYLRRKSGLIAKPDAAEMDEWTRIEEADRKSNPIMHWVIEEGFDYAQDFIYFVPDIYQNVKHKCRYYFVDQSHVLQTKLKRFEWHSVDEKIFHGVMEELVRFVEEDKSHMQTMDRETIATNKREDGLAYLDWEISLGEESPSQSVTAKEVKEIYLWYKDVYPNRVDPMVASGWSDYCDRRESEGAMILSHDGETEEERNNTRELLKRSNEIEQGQYDEENDMLIRVVRMRQDLWT
ncbi:MAG: hypothetical protein GY938_13835 [Ketobacter sp.]|nr:hypothetical protein [Ketobacter sp.]